MVALIVLNIILIVLVTFLLLYTFKNNKNIDNNIILKKEDIKNDVVKIKVDKPKIDKKIKQERVFNGRFIEDEEYQQILKNVIKQSDISILLEDIKKEYEKLKELNNEGTERNNTR